MPMGNVISSEFLLPPFYTFPSRSLLRCVSFSMNFNLAFFFFWWSFVSVLGIKAQGEDNEERVSDFGM
jgi:hypothetical protein